MRTSDLVDEVDAELLEDLRLGEVADAGLGHDRNGDGGDDLLDQRGLGHAGDAALGADHGRNALQSHDRSGAGLFGDARLLDVHHVHDDAAFEHLGEADLEAQAGGGDFLVLMGISHGFEPRLDGGGVGWRSRTSALDCISSVTAGVAGLERGG